MIKVGVIRGGISNERDVSLNTGESVLSVLAADLKDTYIGIDVTISLDGIWSINGTVINSDDLSMYIDIAFIALHGVYGEDGQIQSLLERLHIPYTGSGPLSSRIAIDKWTTKEYAKKLGVQVSRDILFEQYETTNTISYAQYVDSSVKQIIEKLTPPWVIKPTTSGSSIGVSIVKSHDKLHEALSTLLDKHTVLIEEYIEGKEGTVGVLEHFRGEEIYAFLPIEIRTPKATFFDFNAKYSGEAQEISPGNFNQEEKETMMRYAKEIHKGIGLRHYSRSDFIVAKNNKVYFLEVNNLPGLTRESLLPKSLAPVGATFPQFIDHLIRLALESKIV